MKYAVFTVSTPELTQDQVVATLRDIGYDGVEWRVVDQDAGSSSQPGFWAGNLATVPFSTFEQEAPAIRALTENAGLGMPGVGTYVMCDDLAGVEAAIRGTKALGADQFRVRVPNYDGLAPFKPIWNTAQPQYREVVELARTNGVKVLLELHHRSIVPSASAARLFLDDLDPAHVGVIHDAGNMVYEGFEQHRMSLEMLGPYLAHVHIKNARWFPEKYDPDGTVNWVCGWAPVRKGVASVRDLLRALRAIGYDDWIAFEDFSTERPLADRLRENLEYVKSLEAEVKAEPTEA